MSLKDLLKTLKSDKIIIPKLEQHLMSKNRSGKGDGWIHPSGITNCKRSIVLGCLGYPFKQNLPARVLSIFETGNVMHTKYQTLLKEAGLLLLCEFCGGTGNIKGKKCEPCRGSGVEVAFEWKKYRTRGTCDGLFDPKKVGDYMLELKSMNTNSFQNLTGPNHAYMWQCHIYMRRFQRTYPNLDKTLFIFEDKNTQAMKEFVVKWDDEIWGQIFERIKEINSYVDAKKFPEGDCVGKDLDKECQFADSCKQCGGN